MVHRNGGHDVGIAQDSGLGEGGVVRFGGEAGRGQKDA